MKKTLLSIITILAFSFPSLAQDVNIPDANFKAYLVGNSAINTNSDTEIQVSEAAAFAGNIFGNNLNISDLTGIEAFTSIVGLYCRDNSLGSIDISANTALTYIDCQNTNLSALNISNNTALTGVTCSVNSLSSLDVSNNTALTAINCSDNDLTNLDVSNNVSLSNFSCDNNSISSLDVSNNTALIYFVCHFNDLTSLDLGNNTSLSHFSCAGNDLSSLDVSNITSLGNLYCALNNIGSLDLSANSSLIYVDCSSNNLSSLNALNGNNLNINTFYASGNSNLTCIQVDDEAWSTTNWTSIDATASFSLDCGYTNPVSSISVQGQAGASTITDDGGSLQMEAEVLPLNADDDTYTWSVANGTGSASIDADGLLTAITDGNVTVTSTANDGSGVTGDAVITISNQTNVGIDELDGGQNLTIFPNPVKSQLSIQFDKTFNAVVIVDIMGKTVKTIVSTNHTIDVSDLTNGIYFLQIQTNTGWVSSKFIKE